MMCVETDEKSCVRACQGEEVRAPATAFQVSGYVHSCHGGIVLESRCRRGNKSQSQCKWCYNK